LTSYKKIKAWFKIKQARKRNLLLLCRLLQDLQSQEEKKKKKKKKTFPEGESIY